MEGLKSGGVGGSSCSNREDEYWRDGSSLLLEFVHKRGIFISFSLDSLSCKSIVGVCEFNELYFDVRIRMERWGAILWDALGTKYVRFESGIAVASCLRYEHGSSHCGTVLSSEEFMNMPAFMRV